MKRVVLGLGLVAVAVAGVGAAMPGLGKTDSALRLATYESPSGEFILTVEPSHHSGAGPSKCEVTRRGKRLWARELPFTFADAVVNDAGVSAGYAYTLGSTEVMGEGTFVVAILTPKGNVAVEDEREMSPTMCLETPAQPRGIGIFHHPITNQLVVRVRRETGGCDTESWWHYDLNTLVPVSKTERTGNGQELCICLDVLVLPATPLTLVHWYTSDFPRSGARFVLLDERLEEVWRLSLPDDYTFPHSERGILDDLWEDGAVLVVEPRAFELRLFQENERVAWAVREDPGSPGGWLITETARTPYRADNQERNPR